MRGRNLRGKHKPIIAKKSFDRVQGGLETEGKTEKKSKERATGILRFIEMRHLRHDDYQRIQGKEAEKLQCP
ncbi:hypothetical protein D6792_04060 [Candidatus Parcubacteria bacterium]|nr:MAG: hypothetical protein D6792_04060 [Candidatus Parcubacteria bacterium]GIW69118.1 MAG: hypothetical protein KatS3mg100_612 [Candidatus Parcubacteria bacterium]